MQVTEAMHVVRNTEDMDTVDATTAIFLTTRRRCVIHREHHQKTNRKVVFIHPII